MFAGMYQNHIQVMNISNLIRRPQHQARYTESEGRKWVIASNSFSQESTF